MIDRKPERFFFQNDVLYCSFTNPRLKQIMHIEFYNDGDIGYIIENYEKKKIVENKDVNFFSLRKRIEEFVEDREECLQKVKKEKI